MRRRRNNTNGGVSFNKGVAGGGCGRGKSVKLFIKHECAHMHTYGSERMGSNGLFEYCLIYYNYFAHGSINHNSSLLTNILIYYFILNLTRLIYHDRCCLHTDIIIPY